MNTRTKDIAAARGKPTHSSVPDNPESTLTEDALSNSQAHLSCAFQDAAIGMALVGLDGHWLQVNPALCKLVGYTQPELLATTFQAITHPDDLDTDLAFVRQVLASEIPTYQMEKRYFHKQGHIVWILLDVSLVRDPATHPLFFIAQIQDISKRKWAEEALRTSQEMLHQALQASNTGLWVWNTESNEVSYSKEWKGQLGYKEAELTDDFQTWETRLHPDDHAQAMTYLRAYTAQPVGDYQYEFRLRHKDGTYRWIETRATFVTEPDGRQIRLLGSHTDITARKHMETTLRESEAWHQTMIEAIPQQVWTARPDGTLEYVNRRVLDYFGCQEDDLLGWEWESVLHPDDLPACQESWSRALRTGKPYEIEFRLRRASDSPYRWHLARAMPVNDASGRILKWFGTNTDITEVKRTEESLRRSEEQLREAMDERQSLAEDLHDNIIQSIYATGLILEDCKSQIRKKSTDVSKRLELTIQNLNRVIKDVRQHIARATGEEMTGDQLCTKLMGFANHLEGVQGVRFSLDLETAAAKVLTSAQARQILYIVQEAVSNSLRHSQGQIGLILLQKVGKRVRVKIQDDGVGFIGEDAKKRGHGLQNMALRAQKLGGTFQVVSHPGRGTQVLVEFPQAAADDLNGH